MSSIFGIACMLNHVDENVYFTVQPILVLLFPAASEFWLVMSFLRKTSLTVYGKMRSSGRFYIWQGYKEFAGRLTRQRWLYRPVFSCVKSPDGAYLRRSMFSPSVSAEMNTAGWPSAGKRAAILLWWRESLMRFSNKIRLYLLSLSKKCAFAADNRAAGEREGVKTHLALQ